MIQEIINYTKHLKEGSKSIFEHKLKPSNGIHLFIELDEEGNHINWPPEKGKDWDYYKGKDMTPFLENVILYEKFGQRIGTRMDKVFDNAKVENSKKFQIFSCSPYIVSFKKQSYNLIESRLNSFFRKAIEICLMPEDENLKKIAKTNLFKHIIPKILRELDSLKIKLADKEGNIEDVSVFEKLKDSDYIYLYMKNIDIEDYKEANEKYLLQNLFNKADFNSDKELNPETYGLSNFYNGLNQKKPFLEHKTATPYKGISSRIQAKDTVLLNDFDILLRRKVFPQPLPIFIDKKEFKNSDDIINIFKDDESLSYSRILKQLFEQDENRSLKNYYLLFFNYKSELEDFDFVSKFEYKLENCKIKNIFKLKSDGELRPNRNIRTIFGFESNIVQNIFNNSLVRIDLKTKEYKVKYFDEIKAEFVSGGEPVYQMILKYRKAFYDYIYKSKRKALNSHIWDEIMRNNIIADLRKDKLTDKGYHSKEYSIKEKLNIWFSLYNFFSNNKNRTDMASEIPKLLEQIKNVTSNENEHFETEELFAFGAGQLIRTILNKSESGERTHALLEPFLQKTNAAQFQLAIARAFENYKHAFKFYKGDSNRYEFDKIMSEVMAFKTEVNIKSLLPVILAGYFSKTIFAKDETTEQE